MNTRRTVSISHCLLYAVLAALCWVGAAQAGRAEAVRLMRRAQMLERVGRNDEAVSLYRRAWVADPRRQDVVIRGVRLLARTEKHTEALSWVREAVERIPHDAMLWVEYGDIHDLAGDSLTADSVWRQGVEVVSDRDVFFASLVTRLMERQRFQRARVWAEQGLPSVRDTAALHRMLVDICLRLNRPRCAARSAVAHAAGRRERIDELLRALDSEELERPVLDTMLAETKRFSDADTSHVIAAQFTGELALRCGRYDVAGPYFVRAAFAGTAAAGHLLDGAQRLDRAGYPEVAAELFEAFALHFPDVARARTAAFDAAVRFDRAGQHDRAIVMYRRVLASRSGARRNVEAAALAMGGLLLKQHEPVEAREYFRQAAGRRSSETIRRAAELGLAECALHEGRFEEAAARLGALVDEVNLTPGMTRPLFLLAQLALFRGDAAAMGSVAGKLLLTFPSSDEANDCLALSDVLNDARGDTVVWRQYGRAAYAFYVGEYAAVTTTVDSLRETSLAAHGLFLLADAHLAQRDAVQAVADLERIRQAGVSPAAEEATWRLAELLRTNLHDNARALTMYESLLRDYPASVYLGPTRRKIRQLREAVGAI